MSLFLLLLLLGVANWFATTLLVESEIFRPAREWVDRRTEVAEAGWRLTFWTKARYMVGCHMCTGTWVGLAMALFVPWVVGGFAGYLLTALVIKGIGHLVLRLDHIGKAVIERNRAEAAESMMSAMPDLDSILHGLMEREVNAGRTPSGRNGYNEPPFGDMGRVVKTDNSKGRFEPFNPGTAMRDENERRSGGML